MRIARWSAALGCVFFALAAAWELTGPLQGGHWAAMAAEAIAGENMLRFHMFAAVARYTEARPDPSQYYCHHPYLLFLLQAASHALLGHRPATVRLVAVACSALTPPLVYALSREIWDDLRVAAVATLTFVLVPIDLCFAGFAGLEVPTIFFGLLFCWATAALWKRRDARMLAPAFIGALGATQSDWPGVVLVGAVAGFSALGAYAWPRRGAETLGGDRLFKVWLAGAAVAVIGCVALYWALFASAGQLDRLGRIFRYRSGGALAPLSEIFGPRRRMWIAWMFTPPGVAVPILALPVTLARLRARPLEVIPLAWLLMASVQYFVFREGADMHIFWPHYFGVSVALGMGVLTHALVATRQRCIARGDDVDRPRRSRGSRLAVGVLVALPLLVFARVSLPQLRQARLTSGRFDEAGLFIDAEADASQFAAWAMRDAPADALARRTGGFPGERHIEYSVDRPLDTVSRWIDARKPGARDRIVLIDVRRTPPADLQTYARRYDVDAVGPFWRLDRAGHGALRALRYVERQPEGLERYWITGTDEIRSIGPDVDPWATWEWLDHLGLPAPEPVTEPVTQDELRIAHNLAVSHHAEAAAADLRARVEAGVSGGEKADLGDDVHLLGVQVQDGPAPVARLLWFAGPTYVPVESSFAVRCKVVSPPPLWPSAVDFHEKDMAPPMRIPPALWKPGYLYAQRFVVRHRIGVERCEGTFSAPELRASAGSAAVWLFTMP